MREKVTATLEGVVIGAIVLVLVQTFLEDFATLVGWSWSVRKFLIFTGFSFDLFFTVEFLVRLYTAVFRGRGVDYLMRKRGWIDFAASIPLLLFSSGPAVLTVLSGGTMVFAVGSILNVLKVVKAVRIARILRLLRVLKVFKQIKHTNSTMAQRHVAKITAMTVTLFVFTVFIGKIVSGMLGIPSSDDIVIDRHKETANIVLELASGTSVSTSVVEQIAARDNDLLVVKSGGETVYSRFSNEVYTSMFGPTDYWYFEESNVAFFFDNTVTAKLQSRDNLLYFTIIILLVVLLLVYYSPHFALTVTDPIHVMLRGMEDAAYNFEVKIPERYREDDIYRLAQAYNSVFLPLKDLNRDVADSQSSVLDFDDIKNILETE